jgi:capsular polysaccharide export protein
MKRNFLFLQGPTSLFFNKVADTLRARGHFAGHIHFNVGDSLFGCGSDRWHFRSSMSEFSAFLLDVIQQRHITDIHMLGDTRPAHEIALKLIDQLGLVAHIWEEGYFRPGWLTLERGGINGHSRLPKEPKWYRDVVARLPEPFAYQPVSTPIHYLAAWEIAYHVPNLLNPILYPGYQTNRPAISGIEMCGWAWRFSQMPYYKRRDARQIERLLASKKPFFVLPLQLDGDDQLTRHSSFESVSVAIRLVMTNFAEHAISGTSLVIKNHPLDTGLIDYGKVIRTCAVELDIEDSVLYLETGDLDVLLMHAQGVVTINSTVGTAALALGCPVIALGHAIYDIEGLTFQGELANFWRDARSPDAALYVDFRRVVIHTTQVNGGFYSRRGFSLAAHNALRFIEADQSPLEEFLV